MPAFKQQKILEEWRESAPYWKGVPQRFGKCSHPSPLPS